MRTSWPKLVRWLSVGAVGITRSPLTVNKERRNSMIIIIHNSRFNFWYRIIAEWISFHAVIDWRLKKHSIIFHLIHWMPVLELCQDNQVVSLMLHIVIRYGNYCHLSYIGTYFSTSKMDMNTSIHFDSTSSFIIRSLYRRVNTDSDSKWTEMKRNGWINIARCFDTISNDF